MWYSPLVLLIALVGPVPPTETQPFTTAEASGTHAVLAHLRDELRSQPSWLEGEIALDPRPVCPRCPTGWMPARAEGAISGLTSSLSLRVATAAQVYLDVLFLGRPPDPEMMSVTGVIAVGGFAAGSPEVEVPATTWWHRDEARRPVVQRDSVVRLRQGSSGWEVVEVRHTRTILVGMRASGSATLTLRSLDVLPDNVTMEVLQERNFA